MPARPVLFLIALGLFLAAGCGPAKLNENKTYTLEPGEANGLLLPAITKPQKITVEFTSSAVEVKVFLFKDSDVNGEDQMFLVDSKKALDMKQGKEGSFTVDVPANTATRVVIRAASAKTEVTIKVTNSK